MTDQADPNEPHHERSQAPPLLPQATPRACPLPGCGGLIGAAPEHFEVEELPAYAHSGEGEHLYLWIEKKGRNTRDVTKMLAQVSGVRERDIGFAGMKDRNAITRQWFSLAHSGEAASTWDLGDDVRILQQARHNNKLRTGHLLGNRFRLTLVGLLPSGPELAQATAEHLRRHGIPNYFGPQRFGRDGRNLEQALAWLKGLSSDSSPPQAPRPRRSRRKGRGPDEKMLSSVIQSEIFNRFLALRLAAKPELKCGDVVRLSGSKKHFIVEDLAAERARYESGDILLTGPMIGPKTVQAGAEVGSLEAQIVHELGLASEDLEQLGRHAPGARRDCVIFPEELEVERQGQNITLAFSLPAGAYATNLVREFSGASWGELRMQHAS